MNQHRSQSGLHPEMYADHAKQGHSKPNSNLAADEIRATLQPVLAREDTIIASYLFGSAAKGQMRPGSDIDVALLLDENEQRLDRKRLLDRFIPLLSRAVRHDIHISILNDASYLLRVQVIHTGKLIHVTDKEKLAQFQMISTSLYADFAHYLEMMRNGLQKK
ncbi:type VII toxin-antitoxin system MntA family adenylyltransferase antitoxin [Desulfonatronum parangueonense]